MPFVSYSSCQNSYGVINQNLMVCAGRTGKDSCQASTLDVFVQLPRATLAVRLCNRAPTALGGNMVSFPLVKAVQQLAIQVLCIC